MLLKLSERIAKSFVAPTLLNLLESWDALWLTTMVQEDASIVDRLTNPKWAELEAKAGPPVKTTDPTKSWKTLQEDWLRRLKLIGAGIPFKDTLLKEVGSVKWANWFFDNELKHKRPDLSIVLQFNPKAREWMQREFLSVLKFILGIQQAAQ